MTELTRAVGHFEILREIGRGGMARVYLARQTDLDRLVALKELSAFHASDPQFAQRFLRESRLAGSLSHPNIVTVLEYFEHEGTPFIAMEYVPRGSLRPYVGRLTLAQVVGVIEGILAGLTHAETKKIVHRDLKPENVMVTDEGRVKIADFGIAKATQDMQTGAFATATGTTVGTPAYMAPEQAMARDIGPWTDLYSLGVMAYEMLVGRLPFPTDEAPMVMLMRIVNEPVPPPRSINPDLDPDLAAWIERLLAKDPNDRIRSGADAWDELEETVIRIFGARWRREARLPATAAGVDELSPLTPAPFTGAPGTTEPKPAEDTSQPSEDFQSFSWSQPVPATPPKVDPAPPPMPTPPPAAAAPAAPSEPDVDAGYETAAGTPGAEAPADAAQPAEAEPAVEEPSGYETAAGTPGPEAPPAADAPATAEAPPAAEPPPATDADAAVEPEAPPEPEHDPFRTYGHRTPPPVETPPEPEPAAEPEPEPEEEWGATLAPERMPSRAAIPTPEPVVAEPRRVEEPDQARPPGGRGVLVGLIVGIAVVAIAIGFVLAPSKKQQGQPEGLPNSTSAGPLELAFPASWHKAAAPAIPGLALTDPIGLAGPARGLTVAAGKADGVAPTLLPTAFLARLGSAPPAPEAVKLGDAPAYRYANLSAQNPDQKLTVYAVPTDAGTVAIACVGIATIASPDCEAIATSLKLDGAKALGLGPDPAYAKALGAALNTLNGAAAQQSETLVRAKSRAAQSKAANDLAKTYTNAAKAINKLPVRPSEQTANAAIAAAATAIARDYKALGQAAKSGDSKRYRSATTAVAADDAKLTKALTALKALGYAPA